MEQPTQPQPEHDGSHCWQYVWHEDTGEELRVCMHCHLCGMDVVVWKVIGTAECRGQWPPDGIVWQWEDPSTWPQGWNPWESEADANVAGASVVKPGDPNDDEG